MSASMIAVNLTVAALLLLAAFLLLGMCRAAAAADREQRPISVWDQATRRWVLLPTGEAPGPGQFTPRQMAEIDALAIALAAPAFDPATDPQWAAGQARLLNDLNNQGDQ